jgi:hypothetical protein
MRCSKCSRDNREGRKFCAECGVLLAPTCAKCGAVNEPNEKFCGECGAPLTHNAGASVAQSPPAPWGGPSIRVVSEPTHTQAEASAYLDGERKTVTALFADIKGSTELIRDLDPEEARALVDPVLQIMMTAVHRYHGYVAQSTGDGIFAMFGAPVAHEDHAQRALHAALAIQDELRRYREKT